MRVCEGGREGGCKTAKEKESTRERICERENDLEKQK